jgi:HAD superfamily hydrolase (TIGR01549 family)
MEKTDPPLRAVLFDMDGTLTRPTLDFRAVRAEIGLPEPLLENMLALPKGATRDRAFALLEKHEEAAALSSVLNPGTREILSFLEERGIRTGLVTRNSRKSVRQTLARHGLRFDAIRSREDGPVKPDPFAILGLCEELGALPEETLLVGDYKYDIQAGERAGTRTVLLVNGAPPLFRDEISPDHVIHALDEMASILDQITKR